MNQQNLFSPWAEVIATQGELFASRGAETKHDCKECGRPMVKTASDYLACPHGCGKLIQLSEVS